MKDCRDISRQTNKTLSIAVVVAMCLGICFALTSTINRQRELPECDGKINLNIASAELLQELPGIGKKKAIAIIDCRKNLVSGFTKPQDLQIVKGIGPATVKKMEHLIEAE